MSGVIHSKGMSIHTKIDLKILERTRNVKIVEDSFWI